MGTGIPDPGRIRQRAPGKVGHSRSGVPVQRNGEHTQLALGVYGPDLFQLFPEMAAGDAPRRPIDKHKRPAVAFMDDAGKLGFGNRRQRFPRPGGSGKAKQHGEQQDGRAQTVPQRRRIPGRCAPPARLVSRLNGPSKENPFQGTPGTGIQSTQTPLKREEWTPHWRIWGGKSVVSRRVPLPRCLPAVSKETGPIPFPVPPACGTTAGCGA